MSVLEINDVIKINRYLSTIIKKDILSTIGYLSLLSQENNDGSIEFKRNNKSFL